MTLACTTYSAFRGYDWSVRPEGLSLRKLNQFYRMISGARGDFRASEGAQAGIVSDGKTVAAFTIQNVAKWDAERRASIYAALAFLPIGLAVDIDFIELLGADFFRTPSRCVKSALEYTGPTAAPVPAAALRALQANHAYLLRNPHAIGSLLTRCGSCSTAWSCLLKADGLLDVKCQNWINAKGS